MSDASDDTFKGLPKDKNGRPRTGLNVQQTVEWVRQYGPITIHALADLLDAKGISWPTKSTRKTGQVWSELMSRMSDAANDGLLDDDETVKYINPDNGVRSRRTIYKYLAVPRSPRLTGVKLLRQQLKLAQGDLKEMKIKYEMACRTIDKLRAEGASVKNLRFAETPNEFEQPRFRDSDE